jgi:DinB family protein
MDQRYPVGKFTPEENLSDARRSELIGQIAEAPAKLRQAVKGLDEKQLDTPYRDGGWTVRQVAHHLPDSHMNAFVRFKLGLTEAFPTIKPYDEKLWAELADAKLPIEPSLTLLESLHARWVTLLKAMSPTDYQRKIKHPELGELTLERYLGLYAWHGRHHVAHVMSLRERMGWK